MAVEPKRVPFCGKGEVFCDFRLRLGYAASAVSVCWFLFLQFTVLFLFFASSMRSVCCQQAFYYVFWVDYKGLALGFFGISVPFEFSFSCP
jgi:hypothetical protein